MPMHDWTRVDAGVFHDFHLAWIAEIRGALNKGLLPGGYYALAEQVTTAGGPDVLALHSSTLDGDGDESATGDGGGTAVATALLTARPVTQVVARAFLTEYVARQRRIAIRRKSGDRVVALIEIVSSGNKAADYPWQVFIDEAIAALNQGVHLLILDIHPPTPRDPGGVHGAFWGRLAGDDYASPPDADRTLAAYSAGPETAGFIEPVSFGHELRPMPLFLTPDGERYVNVPLEATYRAAYEGVPRRYRRDLEGAV